jgi:hypothetical protein
VAAGHVDYLHQMSEHQTPRILLKIARIYYHALKENPR